jgi:outer membrane protease
MKKTACILLFAFFSASAFCGDGPREFNLEFSSNIFFALSREIVYAAPASSRLLSELRWDTEMVIMPSLSFTWKNRLSGEGNAWFVSAALSVGDNLKKGTMQDRDWLEPSAVPGSLTLFSEHKNTFQMVFADLESGLFLPAAHGFSLKLSLAFSYMFFTFKAIDGYIQYGPNIYDPNPYRPWDASWPKTAITGRGVDYTQHWIAVKPALGCQWKGGPYEILLSVSLSPFVYAYAEDTHYMHSPLLFTRDTMSGALIFEPKGSIFWKGSDRVSGGITVLWRYVTEMRGDLEQEERYPAGTVSTNYRDISGTSLECFSVGVTIRYTF